MRIEVVRELTIAEPTKAVHDIFALVAAADVVSSGVEGGRVAAAQGTTLTVKRPLARPVGRSPRTASAAAVTAVTPAKVWRPSLRPQLVLVLVPRILHVSTARRSASVSAGAVAPAPAPAFVIALAPVALTPPAIAAADAHADAADAHTSAPVGMVISATPAVIPSPAAAVTPAALDLAPSLAVDHAESFVPLSPAPTLPAPSVPVHGSVAAVAHADVALFIPADAGGGDVRCEAQPPVLPPRADNAPRHHLVSLPSGPHIAFHRITSPHHAHVSDRGARRAPHASALMTLLVV